MSNQKPRIIELTPEEELERKRLIALTLVEELKQHNNSSEKTTRDIIIKRAKEYARYCKKISDVSRELSDILANKGLCSKRHVRRVLSGEEFEQFKDIHKSKNRSHPNKPKSSGHMSTQITESSPIVETEAKSKPKPKTTIADEPLPQHILDARKAIDESNEFQSLVGNLNAILEGKQIEYNRAEDVGKTMERKIIEQSHDNMLAFVKRIPDGHFRSIKIAIGRAGLLIEKFEELLSNEEVIRKRSESMAGV